MGKILIKGQDFYFQDVELTYENATIIDKSIAKNNLLDFKHVMEHNKVPFYIMHGTLLGAVREHEFIKHDIDIDTCTFNEQELIETIPALDAAGLKLCRYESGVIYSFIRDGVYIDVYIAKEIKGLMGHFFVKYLYQIIPKKYFRKSLTMNFLGETFSIPNHTEDLLVFWYGKDWRTPVSNAPSNDEYPLGKWLHKHFRTFFKEKKQ